MPSKAERLAQEARSILDQADVENRVLTGDERVYVADLINQAKERGEHETALDELGRQLGPASDIVRHGGATNMAGGPGDLFVQAPEYKRIRDPQNRGQTWSTGPVKVSDVALSFKGTLLESNAGGPGGGLTPPAYEQGVVSKLFEPLGVADVFASSQTVGSQVRYAIEGTALSGAAGVAEAGTKPESQLVYSEVSEPVKKIATVLPVSDEMLEDAPAIQTYLNSRLSLFVKIEEERQLLRGSGTNELVGVLNRTGSVAPMTYAKGADNNAVAILKAAAGYRGTVSLDPDAIIMHPCNWLTTRLLQDANQQFYFGGPAGVNTSGLAGAPLRGMQVVLSSVVGSGTALLGSFGQAAHIWRLGGVTIDASNSHASFYVQN